MVYGLKPQHLEKGRLYVSDIREPVSLHKVRDMFVDLMFYFSIRPQVQILLPKVVTGLPQFRRRRIGPHLLMVAGRSIL